MNSRQKGKTYERELAKLLAQVFPDVRRNAGTQSQAGGVDLENTGCFDFEVKGGEHCKIKKVDGFRQQLQQEGKEENYKAVWVRPTRDKGYFVIETSDFLEILDKLKGAGVI